ncbi:MAG TPA: glycogen debranching enzyme GlgX, partial [Afifellaceae bacterium]|nr:glycogen debranching enzyme GlgX [Afifellaceae bacterium]
EWNDGYRDSVRRYWRGDPHSAQDLCAKLLGSAELFDRDGRRTWTSLHFITAHDGFTLADVTRYNEHHNKANGENNSDGHHSNFSDNCGVEGETDDPAIREHRAKRQRNMLATLFLSQGTPMLLAGDEFSNSQQGNNNAYCQDNPIGWLNWEDADEQMIDFVARLSKFRSDHPCLRQSRFLHGAKRDADGMPDVEWTDFKAQPLQWRDPGLSNFCVTLRGSAEMPVERQFEDTVFIAFNRGDREETVTLPALPEGRHWLRAVDTAASDIFAVCELDNSSMLVEGHAVVAAVSKPDESPR